MRPTTEEVRAKIRAYIAENVLGGENADELEDSTPLITGGVMDSISTIQLVDFLEKEFHVQVQAHEVDQDNLNSISLIAEFVRSKV